MSSFPYTHDELMTSEDQRSYPGDAAEAKFLLGGIGTGNGKVIKQAVAE